MSDRMIELPHREGEPLRIAIDWDNTYTADPELWESFIALAQERGHRVCICTCRRATDENRAIVKPAADIPVYFTGMSGKRWYMNERKLPQHIWIDDSPESVKGGR